VGERLARLSNEARQLLAAGAAWEGSFPFEIVSRSGFPSVDARRALAQLCALGGRFDEARAWFDRARSVLEEEGARPLRALVDLDEAWMEARRGQLGDRERALALLEAARAQFEVIGMSGWLRRAKALQQELTEGMS
jgi:tetratricopeptide (TPR) repeat protein